DETFDQRLMERFECRHRAHLPALTRGARSPRPVWRAGTAGASAQAESARAGRPGAPALLVEQQFGALDLLGARVLMGPPGAADGPPRRERELEPAVVAVAG